MIRTGAAAPCGAGGRSPALPGALADPEPGAPPASVAGRGGRMLLLAGLVAVGFNLRPALSSLGPVLPEVMRDTGLTPAGASLLTTLPMLCLGLFGFLAPRLTARLGTERSILACLLLLVAGIVLRLQAGVAALAGAAVTAGAAIGVMNVLLPGLVKRDFPTEIARMTGVYSMALCLGAAIAAGATVPLERALGGSWSLALSAWALPALAAALLWLPQVPGRARRRAGPGIGTDRRAAGASVPGAVSGAGARPGTGSGAAPGRSLLRDGLAWQVTMLMGLQSAMAYAIFAWLAPIIRDRGFSPSVAGYAVSLSVMAQVVGSLGAPALSMRGRDQRAVGLASAALAIGGMLGVYLGPTWLLWGFALVQGLGQGALFGVAMIVIVLRSPDARTAARLSAMAQGIGYALAAGAPLLVGVLRQWTGGWDAAITLFVALGVAVAVSVAGAGRARHIGGGTPGPA